MFQALAVVLFVAQTDPTLDAVRLHQHDARARAVADLEACGASCTRGYELTLLVGYLELAEGDARAAVKRLSSREPAGPLAPFHSFYLGQALFYSRAYAAAVDRFETARTQSPPGWLDARVRARLGESQLAAGDAPSALVTLEEATREGPTPELLWQRAQARSKVRDTKGQQDDLKILLVRFPTHPYGKQAFTQLGRGPAGPPLTFDEHHSRARALLAGGDPAGAIARAAPRRRPQAHQGPQRQSARGADARRSPLRRRPGARGRGKP